MSVSAPVIEDDPLPDSPLYHYTDAGGLHGILGDEALWATHAGYLNDSQEFVFGIQKVEKALKLLAEDPPDELKPASVLDLLTPIRYSLALSSFAAQLGRATVSLRENFGPFVTCLSTSDDQLSQWRGYGKGGGYSIRFNTQKFRESVQRHDAQHRFVEMRYEKRNDFDPALREQLIKYLKEVAPYLPSAPVPWLVADLDVEVRQKIDDIVEPLIDSALNNATRQKHWGFREENEYRIIAFGTAHFHTPHETGLVPRVKITFDPGCIEEIMVGPGQHMEGREYSVRSYIQKHSDRYKHVKVTSSETPFTGI